MHKLTIGVTIKANRERNYNIHQPQPGQANNHRLSGYQDESAQTSCNCWHPAGYSCAQLIMQSQ